MQQGVWIKEEVCLLFNVQEMRAIHVTFHAFKDCVMGHMEFW